MSADEPSAAFSPTPPTPPQGNTVESEHLSELTEEEYEAHYVRRQDLKGFLWLDAKYLNPFFTRRLTQEVGRRPGVPRLPPSGPAVAKSRVGREDPRAGLGGGLSPLSVLSFPASRAGYACSTLHLLFFLPCHI